MSDKEIEKTILALEETIKENQASFGSVLQITNHTDQVQDFLSEKTQKALAIKSMYLTQISHTGECFKCIFLSAVVKTHEILVGLKAISEDLNTLSELDMIHSTLAPLSSFDLARQPGEDPTSAVFAFVLVPADRVEEAKNLTKYSTNEGEMGKTIGSVEKNLPLGDFLANVRISHMSFMFGKDSKTILDDTIQEYLNILPKGTEVVGVEQCTIVDLSVPYEVRFRNPLMKAFKEVRLQHMRHAEVIGDKIEQFSLLTGIEYIKR